MHDTHASDIAGSESWFLAQVEKPQIDVALLLQSIEKLRADGLADAAESRAELLQDSLAERGLQDEALQVMEQRAAWAAARAGGSPLNWQLEAVDILGNTWESKALIDGATSERIVSARESLRRLRLLRSLKEGAFVYDKTWGMGAVGKVDLFNKKVEIDFERKLGHQLSLAYAAETLQLIDENHLLVWKKHKSAELKELVVKQPAEVIRLYLRSFGPAPIAQIQQTLQSGIVAETDWKRFWDAARKALKSDPGVLLPATRSESLRLAPQAAAADAGNDWYAALARERDLKTIVERFEELAEQKTVPTLSESERRVLSDRLAYVLHGATRKQLGVRARALIAASRLALESGTAGDAAWEEFFAASTFEPTMRQMSVRASRAFLRCLAQRDAGRLEALLIRLLPGLDIGTLNEAIAHLIESGREPALVQLYQSALAQRNPSVELLSWLSRNMDRIDAWALGAYAPWVMMMIDELEEDYMGDRLKAQNQMRERFARNDWLKDVLANLDNQQRRNLLARVKDSSGWDTLDKQSVMAQIVKLYPQLEEILVARAEPRDAAPARAVLTSRRSYRERQIQLQRIVSVELPKVAKDIGIARSYGDLRENFEFKAAKEHQLVLMRKRDELDDMLRRVTPSDFRGFPAEQAGMGAGVVLEYADGKRERYFILGEWDGDPALGIISCNSRMALALTGRRAGEQVTVPTEHGEAVCRVVEVTGLTDDVQAWVDTESAG
jgi:transcription elongation GreA/GreB family factor